MNSILMSRTPSSYDVAIDQRYSSDFRLPDLVRSLQQLYSPDSIQLLFKSLDNVYEALAYTGDTDSDPSDDDCAYLSGLSYDFVPAQKIKKGLERILYEDGHTSWTVFKSFLALLDPLKNQNLCLENMIAFKQKSAVDLTVARVSSIIFKSCILEHSVLHTVSRHLPKIDRLVFDTSCILMDEPYNLKLHLPFTSIHTLKVVIRPLIIALEYFVYDYDYRTCKLENNDLLAAISPKGHYTLKIETDSKTYISKRQCGKITEDNCDDVAAGTEDNFLIWIKCRELIQCLVTANESCEDFELIE